MTDTTTTPLRELTGLEGWVRDIVDEADESLSYFRIWERLPHHHPAEEVEEAIDALVERGTFAIDPHSEESDPEFNLSGRIDCVRHLVQAIETIRRILPAIDIDGTPSSIQISSDRIVVTSSVDVGYALDVDELTLSPSPR